ncbi:MAG: hypothetical protein ACI3YK_05505 [Eubacteriales bacterium]
MKKIILTILAAGLAALTLASCSGETETTTTAGTTTTPVVTTASSPATSEQTTPAATTNETPETTPAVTTNEDPEVTPDASLRYSIDLDLTIIDGNAGIVFGGKDGNNFVMWQLAIGEYDDGNLYFRPHTWVNGGAACINEIVINDIEGLTDISCEYGTTYHMTIRVMTDGYVTTLINNVEIDYTDDIASLLPTDEIGLIGFRCDAYKQGTIPEIGGFDNLVIADGKGNILYQDDFSDPDDSLLYTLLSCDSVVIDDGVLTVTGKFLDMADIID